MSKKDIARRTFIKRAAIGTGLSALFSGIYIAFKGKGISLDDSDQAPVTLKPRTFLPPEKPLFVVARGKDPARLAEAALEAHGGLAATISKGDTVLLKPNIGWDRPARTAANTNPQIVRTVAERCVEAGAKKVIVSDNSCNNPARCFDRSGIRKELAGLPVDLLIPTERDFVEVDVGGETVKKWPVLRAYFECDRLINLPVAKHHSSAVLTLGMKNWYGILGGGRLRGQLHQEMATGIVDLAQFARPDLTLLDAFRVIFRNGPQGGSLADTKDLHTVALSADPVAVDAFGATLFGLQPQQVPFIPAAVDRGLGRADYTSLDPIEVEV